MRRIHRVVLLLGLLAPVLSACADFDMDKLDIFGLNEKKKLPGERKDLFPGGVPGVTQGIPAEYRKGYQPPPDTPITPEGAAAVEGDQPDKKTAAVQPTEQPKPKPKRKPKPRPPQQAAQPQGQQQQPPQQPQPQPQPQPAPWPSSPPAGTFSR